MSQKFLGPLRAVVFDWAGTVIDYGSRAPVVAVMNVFADSGVPVTVEEARAPMGMAKRDHLAAVLSVPRVAAAWRERHGQPPDEDALEGIYRRFLVIQPQIIVDHVDVIPGCLAALDHCRQRGLALGSSTGYTRALMDVLVPAARGEGLQFDAVVCADDVPQGRPAPWMCLEAARRLGVFPMKAIAAVDDTTVGVEAAVNAGMWAVGVAKSGNLVGLSVAEFDALSRDEQLARVDAAKSQLHAAGAHAVIDSVADLPVAIDEIDRQLRAGAAP